MSKKIVEKKSETNKQESPSKRNLYIYGFPSRYGGAGTELHHQIYVLKDIPWLKLSIIPTNAGWPNEPLLKEMQGLGIDICPANEFSLLTSDDAIINFCSSEFLKNLPAIIRHTKRTIFVNCMTWLFDSEKLMHSSNNIAFSLYQRDQVRADHEKTLRSIGSKAQFLTFTPYFRKNGFEFRQKDQEFTYLGRISRQDADKYAANTLHIYEYIVAPKWKRGIFLGFDQRSEQKIGKLPSWIVGFADQNQLPVEKFYEMLDFIVQPTDTTENWPRIGMEAMASGVPLVVDNRGGWQYMIEHGKNGFLCNNDRDFIYYGSRLAYDLELRGRIARNAAKRLDKIAGYDMSIESWKNVLEKVYA